MTFKAAIPAVKRGLTEPEEPLLLSPKTICDLSDTNPFLVQRKIQRLSLRRLKHRMSNMSVWRCSSKATYRRWISFQQWPCCYWRRRREEIKSPVRPVKVLSRGYWVYLFRPAAPRRDSIIPGKWPGQGETLCPDGVLRLHLHHIINPPAL